jgi:hypothetical protein
MAWLTPAMRKANHIMAVALEVIYLPRSCSTA